VLAVVVASAHLDAQWHAQCVRNLVFFPRCFFSFIARDVWGRLTEQVAAAKFLELFPEFGAHLFAGAEVLTLCADDDANGMGLCGASAARVLHPSVRRRCSASKWRGSLMVITNVTVVLRLTLTNDDITHDPCAGFVARRLGASAVVSLVLAFCLRADHENSCAQR
jgi:hypothetical protein